MPCLNGGLLQSLPPCGWIHSSLATLPHSQKGGPQCVPVAVDNYNPCAATTCLVGNDCIVNEVGTGSCAFVVVH
jgi:hypothetical protein